MSAADPLAPRQRPRDRRADDQRRASVERMLHGLYAALAEPLLGAAGEDGAPGQPTPAVVADAMIDAGVPVARPLLDRMGQRADLHRLAVRLKAAQAEAAENAADVMSVDPVERLAGLPGRAQAAEAARAYLAAEARGVDAFGDVSIDPAELDAIEREALLWSVAGALVALQPGVTGAALAPAIDRIVADAAAGDGPAAAALALVRAAGATPGLLLDAFTHGHVALGVALLARAAGLRWRIAAGLIAAGGMEVAALAGLAVDDRSAVAPLLLTIARGLDADEDGAAAMAVAWLERFERIVDRPDDARAMLLPVAFTATRDRVARGVRG